MALTNLNYWFTIKINGKKKLVHPKVSILQACEEASIDIPRFCYHEHLSVAGNCRMCIVEIQKVVKPVVSCAMPVTNQLNIWTSTPLIKKARESVLEFLLLNHPLDCPICDQGSECDLQNLAYSYGSDRGRNYNFKRSVEDKECGPIIKTIMTRCIHCTKCVRFSSEISGIETLGVFGRGQDMEIGTYINSFIRTELSGNLVDICPVGALTSKPYAFLSRQWELQKVDTVDFLDAVCSDIVVHTKAHNFSSTLKQFKTVTNTNEKILRILPKKNLFAENWISDRTRYAYDSLNNRTGLSNNSNNKKVSWIDALETAFNFNPETRKFYFQQNFSSEQKKTINFVTETENSAAIFGSLADLESSYVLAAYLKFHGYSDIQYGNFKHQINYDLPFYFLLNRIINKETLKHNINLPEKKDVIQSIADINSLLMVGVNPRFEASLINVLLRKAYGKHALTYSSKLKTKSIFAIISPATSLLLPADHLGSSLRTLISFVENKLDLSTFYYLQKNSSILFGFETTKTIGSFLSQNFIRYLGKKFFTKTKNGERLGMLHNAVGSLALCHLGLNSGVRSNLNLSVKGDKKITSLFTINLPKLAEKKWLSTSTYTKVYSFGIHNDFDYNYEWFFPLKSFYETTGHLVNTEGRVRKYNLAQNAPKEVKSLDALIFTLARMYKPIYWKQILNSFLMLNWELNSIHKGEETWIVEKTPQPFFFNPFMCFEEQNKSFIFSLYPPVISFYLNDILSKNSTLMGECSLFLEQDTNFNLEN